MSKVSLVKTTDSYQGTLKLLGPFKKELEKKLSQIRQVVVKINFVSVEIELATTPFPTVKAFIDFIKPLFKGKIIIAEEASLGETKKGFERFGFVSLARDDQQVEVFDSGEDEVRLVEIPYSQGTLPLSLAKIYTTSSFIVSICRAKTHDTVVVTLSIKNLLVGAIKGGIPERTKIHQGKEVHHILKNLAHYTYPSFSIIDAVKGMQGDGPIEGKPIRANWLLSSFDPLAADSLAAYLMGFKIEDIGYLNLLYKAGFGKLYPKEKIKIVGENPLFLKVPFKPHQTFAEQKKW